MNEKNKNIHPLNHHQPTFIACYVFSNLIWLCYQITNVQSLTRKGDMLICHI